MVSIFLSSFWPYPWFQPSRFIFAEEKWLISGDFKFKDETCKKYEIVKTDYLISECTFGLPIFKWDEASKIANDISNWITNSRKTSLLFCYSLGRLRDY